MRSHCIINIIYYHCASTQASLWSGNQLTKTRYSIPRFFANSHIYLALYIFFILILKKASSIYSVDINYVTILHSIGISYIIYIVSKDIFVNYPSYYGECLRRLITYWPFRCIGLLIASIVIMPIVDNAANVLPNFLYPSTTNGILISVKKNPIGRPVRREMIIDIG